MSVIALLNENVLSIRAAIVDVIVGVVEQRWGGWPWFILSQVSTIQTPFTTRETLKVSPVDYLLAKPNRPARHNEGSQENL